MKIAEIEAKIERGDCSEETLELFKVALKRVPKAYRCQHCYTTAVAMPPRFYTQAISLIQYGLSECCDSWLDRMRSYHNIAIILENNGDYACAQKSYREALDSVAADKRSSYEPEYAAHMMRTEMHINHFTYSDDLFNYYTLAIQADEFSQAFKKRAFYRLVAEIIIFSEQGNLANARKAFEAANEMLQPNYIGPLTRLLRSKGVAETTGASKETISFLRKVGQLF